MVTLEGNHLNQHKIPQQLGLQFKKQLNLNCSRCVFSQHTSLCFAEVALDSFALSDAAVPVHWPWLQSRREALHRITWVPDRSVSRGQYLNTTDPFWVLSGDLGRDWASDNIICTATEKLILPFEVPNVKSFMLRRKVDGKKNEETQVTDKKKRSGAERPQHPAGGMEDPSQLSIRSQCLSGEPIPALKLVREFH